MSLQNPDVCILRIEENEGGDLLKKVLRDKPAQLARQFGATVFVYGPGYVMASVPNNGMASYDLQLYLLRDRFRSAGYSTALSVPEARMGIFADMEETQVKNLADMMRQTELFNRPLVQFSMPVLTVNVDEQKDPSLPAPLLFAPAESSPYADSVPHTLTLS